MKELTAEQVLENTFNHLNDVLDKEEKADEGHGTPNTPLSQSDNEAGTDREKEQKSVVEEE